jgi:putative glutamine amidotransferase
MRIGLTYTGSPEKHLNYERWLKGIFKEDIEIIKLSVDDKNESEIQNCDALVIAGGRDIHPKFYKKTETDYPNSPPDFDEARDAFEIAAFQLAQKKNIPVLGICRGMQLINCILDGTLNPDLGAILNEVHRDKNARDKAHALNVEANTIMSEIVNAGRSVVNSAHHQSIEKLGDGLKVNCTADDGTIEGLEWADPSNKPFLLCIQWHPERMFKIQLESSHLSRTLRDKFIEEIKKSKKAK